MTLVENGEAVARQAQRLLHSVAGGIRPAVLDRGRVRLHTTGNAQTLTATAAHWLALLEPIDSLQI